jgi:hypothetical protein
MRLVVTDARPGLDASLAPPRGAEPEESRTTDVDDLIVAMIAVAAALALDLLVFAFMATH